MTAVFYAKALLVLLVAGAVAFTAIERRLSAPRPIAVGRR